MKYIFTLISLLIFVRTFAQDESYPVDPDSEEHAGVPKGEVLKFTFDQSRIFPGTWREYWVYVPAQYTPDKPACVYVNQDGIQWKAPTVFDNLIQKKEMPVTIGVFVMHGKVRAANAAEANDRFNRSFEYDGLGDAYARFILEEILPEVEKHKTSDGRAIRLSKSGNDRAIGGSSSGAVCAFTAAWERPGAFTRVFSAIGTYVGLRGADRYPTLVRKYEPKPLRIFLQDGSNDLNIYAGDWWMANQTMLRALTFSGYEVMHRWGEGGHNGKQGTAVFPEAMRFLWKDWPAPVQAGTSKNQVLAAILISGQAWESVNENFRFPDEIRDVKGNAYATVFGRNEKPGALTLTKSGSKKAVVEKVPISPVALSISPDQTLLYAAEARSHWIWSFQIQPDGSLAYGQRFGWLHEPDDAESAQAGAMVCDREGRIYVATALGVQILDQAGRVNAILPTPGIVSKIAFGGENMEMLYITAGKSIYRRKLNAKGVDSREKPIKPDAPKL